MNYYEHHIGDYAADAGHLSWDEDMAYTRLIRAYYKAEKPIPADLKEACRLARATSPGQRKAVESVLREFFTLETDGWHQKRCDESIEVYQAGEPEREAKKLNEDARLKRHREERSRLCELLRNAGHPVRWNTSIKEIRALVERHCNAPATPPATDPATPATAGATATQTPIPNTTHQTPSTKEEEDDDSGLPPPSSSSDPIHVRAIEISVLLRKRGAAVTASNPTIREMASLGFSDAQLLTALETAQAQRHDRSDTSPINAGYLLSIVKNPKPARDTTAANETPQQTAQRRAEAKRLAFGGQNPGDVIDA